MPDERQYTQEASSARVSAQLKTRRKLNLVIAIGTGKNR